MTNSLNIIDSLPTNIEINGTTYALVIYPNYEGSLCLSYQDLNGTNDKLFVIVIELGKAHKDDDLVHIEDIHETYAVSNTITAFNLLFNSLIYNGFIENNSIDPFDYTIVDGFEDLKLDYGEEVAIKPAVDINEDDYIKIVNKDLTQADSVSSDIVESKDVLNAARFLEIRIYDEQTIEELKDRHNKYLFDTNEDKNGKHIDVQIDLITGKTINYYGNDGLELCCLVNDSSFYTLYDKDWKTLCCLDGYVPKICAQNKTNYGDGMYISFKINNDQTIENWPTDSQLMWLLNDFIYDAFTYTQQF